jgi:hypothetical protein
MTAVNDVVLDGYAPSRNAWASSEVERLPPLRRTVFTGHTAVAELWLPAGFGVEAKVTVYFFG